MRLARISMVVLAVGAACSGCDSAKQSGADSRGSAATTIAEELTARPGNTYQVRYKPDTIVIDRATLVKTVRSVSTDGSVLVFDASELRLNALAPGKIVLLERVALRRVRAIRRDGNDLAVLTEPATLPDAIENGEIRWNIPVRFAALAQPRRAAERGWQNLIPAAHAAEGHSLSGEKNGWKYRIAATPGESRLNLLINMAKNANGIEVSLDAKGYIPDFDTVAAIIIADGKVREMQFHNRGLSGEAELLISAATKSNPGGFGKKQVKLPAVLKAPFFLGALPLTLEISSAITFTPGLGANQQLATARFRMAYTDLSGFHFKDGGAGAAQNGSSEGEGEILNARGVTLAGIGVVAGVAMPRLEFKLGTGSVVDALERALPTGIADAFQKTFLGALGASAAEDAEESIKTEGAAHVQVVLVGSLLASGPVSLIPCQKTTFSFRADAGADASVLGQSLGEVAVDLFKKEIVRTDPPNITCG